MVTSAPSRSGSSTDRTPEIRLSAKQRAFVKAGGRFPLYRGAIRSGKTYAGAVRTIDRRYRYPGTVQIIGGPSWDQLRDGTMVTLRRLLNPACIVDENKNEHFWQLDNGSLLRFRTLDNPDVLRSLEAHDLWIDEIAMCSQDTLDVAMPRISLPYDAPDFHNSLWGTTTPRGMDFTLEVWGEGGKPELGYDVIHSTIYDNRTNLPEGLIESLEAKYEGTPFFEQELLGKYTAFEGLVYPMFARDKHVRQPAIPLRMCSRIGVGIDPGGIVPTAMVLVGEHKGRMHQYAEFYKAGAELGEMGAKLDEWCHLAGIDRRRMRVLVDDPAQLVIATLRAMGYDVDMAQKDRQTGIKYVGSLLVGTGGTPRLTFSPECVNTIAEFGQYVWSQKRDGATKVVRFTDTPIDHHADAMDACLVPETLIETAEGPTRIEQVRPGMLVATRQGWCPVTAAAMVNPRAAVWTATFSDGRRLTGTGQHPVWVREKGFVRLDGLRYGDIFDEWNPQRLSSTASRFEGTGGTRTTTLTQGTDREESRRSIRRSGRRSTAPFQRGVTSTTWTSILKTTIRPTSCASPKRSTIASTRVIGTTAILSGWPISPQSDHLRQRGTRVKRDGDGTKSMPLPSGLSASRSNRRAKTAAMRSRAWPAGLRRLVSAPIGVRPGGAIWRASTMSRAPAPGAARRSRSIGTAARKRAPLHVVSVYAEIEKRPVYDLVVDGAHEFYANGVLTHNTRYICVDFGQEKGVVQHRKDRMGRTVATRGR